MSSHPKNAPAFTLPSSTNLKSTALIAKLQLQLQSKLSPKVCVQFLQRSSVCLQP